MIFSKLNTREIDRRVSDRALDFVWRPHSEHFGGTKQVFVSAMQDGACSFLDSSPFVADPTLKSFNAERKAKALIEYIEKLASSRRSVNILLPIGCEHQWSNAKYQFDQIDKVMGYVNKRLADSGKDVTLFYSTADGFMSALKAEKATWPVSEGDYTSTFSLQGSP
jgi:lysosomal alpha-mannosidase